MITYQVYLRSFCDSNGDGIGDINGLRSRLEYIASLGVDAIWISPVFKSPQRDFGYDVADYRAIDSVFGTLDDFRGLVEDCQRYKLKLLLDFVGSHTSDAHLWFEASVLRQDGKSEWYLWADPKPDGTPPNNWVSVFGGSAWEWHPVRRQYYFHSFLSTQPDLNPHEPAVREQLLADMRFWLEQGVSGFRFDACNHFFQDLQLRDNPPRHDTGGALHPYGFQVHVHDQGRPETLPFLESVRRLLDKYDAFGLGEVGGTDSIQLMGQYTAPGRLHSAYSFSLMGADGSAAHLRRVIVRLEGAIQRPSRPCYAFSNHDKARVVTRWANGRDQLDTAKQMLALLISMPGHLCLYQGEELGLPQAEVPFDRLQDPFGKRFWPKFKGRDGCRTPMPWTSGPNGGFSTAEPWLPVPPEHLRLNAADQDCDHSSPLAVCRRLLALRHYSPALKEGAIRLVDTAGDLLEFLRLNEGESVRCVYNLGANEQRLRRSHGASLFTQHVETRGDEQVIGPGGVLWERLAAGG